MNTTSISIIDTITKALDVKLEATRKGITSTPTLYHIMTHSSAPLIHMDTLLTDLARKLKTTYQSASIYTCPLDLSGLIEDYTVNPYNADGIIVDSILSPGGHSLAPFVAKALGIYDVERRGLYAIPMILSTNDTKGPLASTIDDFITVSSHSDDANKQGVIISSEYTSIIFNLEKNPFYNCGIKFTSILARDVKDNMDFIDSCDVILSLGSLNNNEPIQIKTNRPNRLVLDFGYSVRGAFGIIEPTGQYFDIYGLLEPYVRYLLLNTFNTK